MGVPAMGGKGGFPAMGGRGGVPALGGRSAGPRYRAGGDWRDDYSIDIGSLEDRGKKYRYDCYTEYKLIGNNICEQTTRCDYYLRVFGDIWTWFNYSVTKDTFIVGDGSECGPGRGTGEDPIDEPNVLTRR